MREPDGQLDVIAEVAAMVSVSPTFVRWLSECRPAKVSPGQVTTGTPIQSASQVVMPPE